GRCYLPRQRLDEVKLLPEVLLSPINEMKFMPVFREHLDRAEAHLAAGWNYINTLPFGQFRVRLACAWPVLIGVRTIEKLRMADVLTLRTRIKVSRKEVRGILFRSLMACPFPTLWRKLHSSAAKAVASGPNLA
ncbi:MAG TPA: squalene/phytoene synthase family protein, partial [Candidatus Binatia bacterium]|nr:squalene/phytoene synthase family protein [Candidatus Binatia bacterium]